MFVKGNKGAVGVSFMFNGTSFGFVNCHLTSGNEKIARYLPQASSFWDLLPYSVVDILLQCVRKHDKLVAFINLSLPISSCRRNQNYLDILRLLSLGDKQLSSFDISLRFTHLFWLGDLNYRLDMDIQVRQNPDTHVHSDGMQQMCVTPASLSSLRAGDFKLHQQEGV